ncbi:hypothetical protein JW933_01845 [candidate division FCPU426 bacterium]|nr:hypothetical protein [candidate division FCPU426 bacterium]
MFDAFNNSRAVFLLCLGVLLFLLGAHAAVAADADTALATSPSGAEAEAGRALPAKAEAVTAISVSVPEQSGVWTERELSSFLDRGNRTEAVMIRQLAVFQNNREVPLYIQTGKEERRLQLRQRPILRPKDPRGPFLRGIDFVARVDRTLDIHVEVMLERVGKSAAKSPVLRRQAVENLYVYKVPGEEREIALADAGGRYGLDLLKKEHCGKVRLQVRSGDERYEIALHFSDVKKPVTIE